MSAPLSDDDWVAQVEKSLRHMRARHAAWEDAVNDLTVDPIHSAVQPTFDSSGTLTELYIAPNALLDFTNMELEVILTDALRHARHGIYDQMVDLFARYLAPGDPRFDPNALDEPFVAPPS